MAAELEKYFENQLNDSERLALATFLSAIRDLTSGTPAEDAPEPGDENIQIGANDQERADQAEQQPQRTQSRPALQPTMSVSRGVEDTTPPITVGPRNSKLAEDYRSHIRSLLVS